MYGVAAVETGGKQQSTGLKCVLSWMVSTIAPHQSLPLMREVPRRGGGRDYPSVTLIA